jgi:hypothetical protein
MSKEVKSGGKMTLSSGFKYTSNMIIAASSVAAKYPGIVSSIENVFAQEM